MTSKFGYWNIRGLGQYVRFILEHVGEKYESKEYKLELSPDGNIEREDWLKEKFNLGLDFPNLPYYMDGEVKLTQSLAILRHIGEKYGLNGSNANEAAMVDMLINEAYDLRIGFARLCYAPTFEADKPAYIDGVKGKLEALSKYLANKDFLIGKLSSADFVMYESLYCIRKLEASLIDNHKNLKDYVARFEALPNIKKYLASSRYISSPINAPMALFGGKKE